MSDTADANRTDGTPVRPEPVFEEPGRTYRSVWLLAAVLVVGFLIDLVLGGAIAHLPGWIAAAVLVIGIDLLVVYAARSTKTLRVEETRLRIGDDAVERDAIVTGRIEIDYDVPVLGWSTGMPRGVAGVTLQLVDGAAIVVPTRRPAELLAALGVSVTPERDLAIRRARRADFAQILEIDSRADTVYRVAGYDLPNISFDESDLRGAAAVFVAGSVVAGSTAAGSSQAGGPVVGYIWLGLRDGLAYVEQLAVLPASMRQGIGSALLEHAADWARRQGHAAMVLTTYADVAWNRPYYLRRGWVETPEFGAELAQQRRREADLGLDEVGRRVVMRKALSP